jgi:hypothetical protein
MKFKTTIPAPPPEADPHAGARTMAGKTNNPESVMTDAPHQKASAVKDAQCEDGAARKQIDKQLRSDGIDGTTSSPKKRDANSWGIGHADDENRKALTK